MVQQIVFIILALVIAVCSVLAVTSKRVIRAATYLLFVLLATSGLFLMLNYHFLFAVQVMVYAGGIMVLFIMAIFLTHQPGKSVPTKASWKVTSSAFSGCRAPPLWRYHCPERSVCLPRGDGSRDKHALDWAGVAGNREVPVPASL